MNQNRALEIGLSSLFVLQVQQLGHNHVQRILPRISLSMKDTGACADEFFVKGLSLTSAYMDPVHLPRFFADGFVVLIVATVDEKDISWGNPLCAFLIGQAAFP